jgi:hypothetical protein
MHTQAAVFPLLVPLNTERVLAYHSNYFANHLDGHRYVHWCQRYVYEAGPRVHSQTGREGVAIAAKSDIHNSVFYL